MLASRLLSLLMLLQSRGRMSAPALARQLEVSVRTVYRDIDSLSAAGVPVYGDAGRNGGYQLRDGWRTQLTGLTPGEARALFLAGLPGPAKALGMGEAAASAHLKLMAALPGGVKEGPATSSAALTVVSGKANEARLAHDAAGAAVIGAGLNTAAITTAARDAASSRFVIALVPDSCLREHSQHIPAAGRRCLLDENLECDPRRGTDILESVRRAALHEKRLAGLRGHRRVGSDRDLKSSFDRNPEVILDVVVRVDAARGARLYLDARHADFRAIDQPRRPDAWVGFTSRLRLSGHRPDAANRCENDEGQKGTAHQSSVSITANAG